MFGLKVATVCISFLARCGKIKTCVYSKCIQVIFGTNAADRILWVKYWCATRLLAAAREEAKFGKYNGDEGGWAEIDKQGN